MLHVVGHHLLEQVAAEVFRRDRPSVNLPGLAPAHLALEFGKYIIVAQTDQFFSFLAASDYAVGFDVYDRSGELVAVRVIRAFGRARSVEPSHHRGARAEVDANDICHKMHYKPEGTRTSVNA